MREAGGKMHGRGPRRTKGWGLCDWGVGFGWGSGLGGGGVELGRADGGLCTAGAELRRKNFDGG